MSRKGSKIAKPNMKVDILGDLMKQLTKLKDYSRCDGFSNDKCNTATINLILVSFEQDNLSFKKNLTVE